MEIINEEHNLLVSVQESGDARMNIQEELRISGHQMVVFVAGTEKYDLYKAVVESFGQKGVYSCGPFMASVFYNLGRVHGIRDERARRKASAEARKDT